MSEVRDRDIEELFPGTDEELAACIDWLKGTGSQLQLLVTELSCYMKEREHAPSLAESSWQGAQGRAKLVFARLKESPDLSCLSADVTVRLYATVTAMKAAAKRIVAGDSVDAIDSSIDFFLAISDRYKHETQTVVKGCVLMIAKRKRANQKSADPSQVGKPPKDTPQLPSSITGNQPDSPQTSKPEDVSQTESAGMEDESEAGNLAKATARGKRRGRKKADYSTVKLEAQLAADWVRARENGVYKADFAREQGMTKEDFDRLLDRVAARNKPSE